MGSFQDLLNAMRGNYKGEMPSIKSMLTGDYKGEIPMPQEPQQPDFRVPSQMPGAMGGGIQQMPYRGGTPTLTEFGQGLEALKKGKERGGVMNDSTYEALQMLQGY